MTADELIAAAKDPANRVGGGDARAALYSLLEMLLSTFDYEELRANTPAIVARSLAACIALVDEERAGSPRN